MCATLRWDGKLSQLTGRMSAAGAFGSEQYLEPEYWAYTPHRGHATGWDTQLGPRQAAILDDRARAPPDLSTRTQSIFVGAKVIWLRVDKSGGGAAANVLSYMPLPAAAAMAAAHGWAA
jgi:hypothetical protein